MAATATPLPYEHEFILPYAGPTVLAGPWRVLRTSSISTVHLFQNTTTSEVTLSTGVAARPTLSVPPGDTILAVTNLSENREAVLVGRLPHSGRRYTTTKSVGATDLQFPLFVPPATYDAGDAFLAFGGVRGACGGVNDASLNVTWSSGTGVPGFVELASVTGVATQPTGDANGNIGTAAASVLTTGGSIPELVGNGGGSGPCSLSIQRWQILGFVIISSEPLDLDAARVRATVSEDAGSLFQATQAVAVELGISEAFEYGADVGSGLRAFREALTPDEVALRYYALPTRNQEMLVTVEGETNLGRLAHTIAPRIFTRGTSIPGNVGGVVTAQQAIQYVVNQWSAEHPWLVFEPIPDLRLLVPEAVSDPRQYYLDNPTAGVLTTSNIVIEQEGNERRTMREVLDEWLRIFPGTILRQTSAGTIEIVPRVGPDAPDGPALELSWRDFARFSDGEDDPRGVYNRARCTSQGWEWEEEHPLLPPLVTVGARGDSAPASAVDDLLPPGVEPLPNNQEREFSTLVDLSVPVQVDVVFQAVTFGNKAGSGAPTVEATIPASFNLSPFAVNQHTFTWTIFGVDHVRTAVNFKRSANGFTVEIPAANRYVFGPNPFVGMRYGVYIVEVTSVTGTAWTRSNTNVEAEWGTEEHHVPAEGGGDALAQSRATYGVRAASLQSNVFQLTPEQAMDVARSYVLFNINPRTVRDVEQSPWDKYPVKFDHIGRYVELPNGEVAVVENRSYSDSFAPRASAMMSTFTATVSHSVIDTTTEFMYLDNGDYAQLDDGTLVEAS